MIATSLTETLARSGYGVTGTVNADRGRKLLETRPIALVVCASLESSAEVELVRGARDRHVPIIFLSLPSRRSRNLVVDGIEVAGASNIALVDTVRAMIGGPVAARDVERRTP